MGARVGAGVGARGRIWGGRWGGTGTSRWGDGGGRVYWLVLCQLDTAGVITEKGTSVGEVPP